MRITDPRIIPPLVRESERERKASLGELATFASRRRRQRRGPRRALNEFKSDAAPVKRQFGVEVLVCRMAVGADSITCVISYLVLHS